MTASSRSHALQQAVRHLPITIVRLAAEECGDLHPIRVFDSLSSSLGQGMTVLLAGGGYPRRHGLGGIDGAPGATGADRGVLSVFSVDALEYLQKGGRIGR